MLIRLTESRANMFRGGTPCTWRGPGTKIHTYLHDTRQCESIAEWEALQAAPAWEHKVLIRELSRARTYPPLARSVRSFGFLRLHRTHRISVLYRDPLRVDTTRFREMKYDERRVLRQTMRAVSVLLRRCSAAGTVRRPIARNSRSALWLLRTRFQTNEASDG